MTQEQFDYWGRLVGFIFMVVAGGSVVLAILGWFLSLLADIAKEMFGYYRYRRNKKVESQEE